MLYVLYGDDGFRRSERLNQIRQQLDPDGNATVRFEGIETRNLTPAALQNACQTASFFAENRLVVIDGLQTRFSGQGRRGRTPKEGDLEAIVGVLSNLPPTTTVVLTDERSSDLLQGIPGAAVESFPQLKGNQLGTWAQARARERGIDIAPAALGKLLTYVDGAHTGELANELEKLGTYAMGRTATVADVDALASVALKMNSWDIMDPIIEGRPERAMRALKLADEKDFHPMVVLAMLRNQVRRLLLAQTMMREGVPVPEIGRKLGMKDFPLQKLIENTGRFPGERLETAFRLVLRADADVKTGVLPIETVLPALIVEMAELQRTARSRTPAGYRG